ncbi:sensor histidine kinase [Pseudonocardia hydrocarbonoxydans]|uniref:Histidine kinase domain-containing protein n=1 Tax=Pseudonocardia hydrocarbonoxydans TaxID=76726 RepID=A0A4Y3WQL0_9PSEU|nr:histidine kinase [Pseudonocardia hydrocarbonoxydans]GEC21064.1 hypothetical protein PHY01_33470 [Pseudonocardia hydrocarbonoxydans]
MTGRAHGGRGPVQWLVDLPVRVLVAAGIGLVAFGLAGVLTGQTGPVPGTAALPTSMAVAFTPLGVFVTRRMPGHPLGRLMLLVGLSATVAALAVAWAAALPAAWLSQWSWWPPLAVIPVLLLLVPDGRLPSPRWRPLAVVLVAAAAVATVALAAAAAISPRGLLVDLATPPPPAAQVLLGVAASAAALVLLATLGVLVALIVRWRAAPALQRRQIACLLPSAVLLVAGVGLSVTELPAPWLLAVAALPLGLTFAVLRYRLHDLDLYVHRGAVWLVLTGLAIATYAVVVTGVSGTFVEAGSPTAALLGAGAVAAILQPAQHLAQRGVSRLLYGRRDDPYAVITSLGRYLGTMRDPLAVLPRITSTIVDELKVPYAALVLIGTDGEATTAAERGRWSGPPQRFPLVAHGEAVGEMLVTPRRANSRFSAAETRLLGDLAGQAALAAEACRTAVALQRARDRLVLAREEERRRLRRDLHDGVASALVGTRMMTDVLRRSLPPDSTGLLDSLASDLDACTAEVRELIDGLRPAALDEGVEKALLGLAERAGEQGPRVSVTVHGDLTDLPAAVEVVVYRVAAEALTNVLKHAHASTVTVVVRRDERHLSLRVTDDGTGFAVAGAGDAGVGLASIRSRVEELGGESGIRSSPSGTVVEALIPLTG